MNAITTPFFGDLNLSKSKNRTDFIPSFFFPARTTTQADTVHFGRSSRTELLESITPDKVTIRGEDNLANLGIKTDGATLKEYLLEKLKEAAILAQANSIFDQGNNGRFFATNLMLGDGSWFVATNKVMTWSEAICSERLAIAGARNELLKKMDKDEIARLIDMQDKEKSLPAKQNIAPIVPKPVLLLLTKDVLGEPTESCAPCQEWEAALGKNLVIGRLVKDNERTGQYVFKFDKISDWLPDFEKREPSITTNDINSFPIRNYASVTLNQEEVRNLLRQAKENYELLKPNVSTLYGQTYGDNDKVNCVVGLLENGEQIQSRQWIWTARLFRDPVLDLIQAVKIRNLEKGEHSPLKAVAYYGDVRLPTAEGLNWLVRAKHLTTSELPIITVSDDHINIKVLQDYINVKEVYVPADRADEPRQVTAV